MISCVYCGSGHRTPAELKQCAEQHGWVPADGSDPRRPPEPDPPEPTVEPVPRGSLRPRTGVARRPAEPASRRERPSPGARRPAANDAHRVPPRALHELGPGTPFWSDGLAELVAGDPPAAPLSVPADNSCAADLAPDQLAAVTHAGGSARILAPAGSGKTRVLTERARHLVRRWGVPTSALTIVAYNRRAQAEIVARTADLPGLQVRTLNSLALAVITGRPPFAAQAARWSTDDDVARDVLARLVTTRAQLNVDPYAPWIEALSVARLGLVDPAEVEARFGGEVAGFAEVFPRFRSELARRGTIDFDEQIVLAIELLLADPTARQAAQRACRVLLVDEFQDLTPAHLLLVRLLAGNGGAVFAVGDDDQTIYGYNGADPQWLIDFERYFPGAGDHPLEVNYRCPAGIVEAADRLLRHNRRRAAKVIRPAADAPAGGWVAVAGDDPVALTVHAVQLALEAGAEPGEVAVLTRVNSLLAPVQVALARAGVPVNGGVGAEFLARTAVRAACAWLQLATGDRYRADDLTEAAKRPSRGFSARLREWVAEQGDDEALRRLAARLRNDKDAAKVEQFADDLARLRALARGGASTSELLAEIFDRVGLSGAVAKFDHNRVGQNAASTGDDLTAVRQLGLLFPDPARFAADVRAALAGPRGDGGVVLATVHRVKGLEWPHVVVHQVDADQFPHRLTDASPAAREEERRLFHVAITRASRHAAIVSGRVPSPFVAELTTEPSDRSAPDPFAAPSARPERAGDRAVRVRPADELDPSEQPRFEALRRWRRSVADGKPPYTVFDDKTLVAILRSAPSDLTELARVKGVGPAKLERFGAAVLAVLAGDEPA